MECPIDRKECAFEEEYGACFFCGRGYENAVSKTKLSEAEPVYSEDEV